MSLSESCGLSGKSQENGDVTCEERPLKKARFAWQVKGYNSRKENGDTNNKNIVDKDKTETRDEEQRQTSHSKDLEPVTNAEQNIEILSDYLLKQDFKTITDSTAAHAGSSASISLRDEASTNDSGPQIIMPDNLAENDPVDEEEANNLRNMERACIARWQANQLARGHVDNTINHVLESWTATPGVRGRAVAFVDFIHSLPNTHEIEDEAILMAISAHGLQHYSSASNEDSNTEEPEIQPNPIERVTEKSESNQELVIETEKPLDKSDVSDVEQEVPVVPSPDVSTTSKELIQDSTSNQDIYLLEYDSNSMPDHCDFMDAAVSHAIQNIGLTPYIG